MSSHTYTGSENSDITDNQISLIFPIKINGEIILNPRLNEYVELHAGTSGFSLLQNTVNGSHPIAIFNPLDKSIKFSEILIYLTFIIKLKQMLLVTNYH